MNSRCRRSTLLVLVAGFAIFAAACGASSVVVTESAITDPTPTPTLPAQAPEPVDSDEDPKFELAPLDQETGADPQPADDPDEPEVDEDPDPASLATLRQATSTTGEAESYRFEIFFSMLIDDGSFRMDLSPDAPLSVGEVSDGTQHLRLDLGPFFDEMLSALGEQGDADLVQQMFGADLGMEMIVDNTTMYLRAPFLAGMASGPAGAGLPDSFSQLDEGWGVIDLVAISGFDAADVVGLAGAQSGSSPDQMLAMLEAAGSEVTDLGPETIRGVETTHLRAVVNMLAMMEAQGLAADDLGALDGAALDVDLPFDVYIDDEAHVRRVELSLSLAEIQLLAPDEDIPPGTDFEFSTTVDMFDFGADISIDVPDESEITGDFTELFAELATIS